MLAARLQEKQCWPVCGSVYHFDPDGHSSTLRDGLPWNWNRTPQSPENHNDSGDLLTFHRVSDDLNISPKT